MQPIHSKSFLLTLVFLLALIAGFGVDLYAPSLPAMTQYFHTESSYTQLALAIYLLGFGIGQPVFGTWSDIYGRKKPLLIGVLIYALASLTAAFATNIIFLIIMRLLQGIGGSACSAVNKAILTDSFSADELPKYATYMSICWGLGPIIAPAIGGYLQHYFGWQSTFALQVIQALIVLLFAICTFTETNNKLIQFNLTAISKTYLTILTHRVFIGSILCMSIMYSLLVIFNVISPFLIQDLLHYSALEYGHIALIIGGAYLLGTLLNRILVNYFLADKLMSVGIYISLIISIGMLIFVMLFPANIWIITLPSFLLFFVGGIIYPNCMGKGMALFRASGGAASAVMGCLFVVGSFIVGYIASLLPTSSIMPMSLAYLVLAIGYIVVKFGMLKP